MIGRVLAHLLPLLGGVPGPAVPDERLVLPAELRRFVARRKRIADPFAFPDSEYQDSENQPESI